MWHRGHLAKARDLYDLCAVADAEPNALEVAATFMVRHGAMFLRRLRDNREFVEAEFDAIDAIGFRRSFEECLEQAHGILAPVL